MELYGIYDVENKRWWEGAEDWYSVVAFIKHRGLERRLSRNGKYDSENYSGRDLVVMNVDGWIVSIEEVLRSFPMIGKAPCRDYEDRLSPELEYGTVFYYGSWRRRGTDTYKYRQTPCTGGSGRWVRRASYKNPKMNKKYWADLQEYETLKKENYWSPWYDDYGYRSNGKSWKRNKKKRQWM